MRTSISAALLALALVGLNPVSANEAVVDTVVLPFFSALQAGDVEAVEAQLGGELLERRRVLLRENAGYAQYLRDYYAGAQFTVGQVVADSEAMTVQVSAHFANGASKRYSLRLRQDADQRWRIIAQDEF